MIQEIVKIPDERLLQICSPVANGEDVSQVIADLWDTCDSLKELDGQVTSCAGLAAPQIGVLKRIFVLNCCGYRQAFINPVLVKTRGKFKVAYERCFSEPGVKAEVLRFDLITAKHATGSIKLNGFASRVFQHELDHLNGKLISRFTSFANEFPTRTATYTVTSGVE